MVTVALAGLPTTYRVGLADTVRDRRFGALDQRIGHRCDGDRGAGLPGRNRDVAEELLVVATVVRCAAHAIAHVQRKRGRPVRASVNTPLTGPVSDAFGVVAATVTVGRPATVIVTVDGALESAPSSIGKCDWQLRAGDQLVVARRNIDRPPFRQGIQV
jgi:hypothetical protein